MKKQDFNVNAVEQLDIVLKFLLSNNSPFPCNSTEEILHHFGQIGIKTDIHHMDAVMIKLKKDEFVSDDKKLAIGMLYNGKKLEDAENPIWFVTFEGRYLIEIEGGYTGRLKKEKLQEALARANENRLRLWTSLAAFGTVGLLIFEIVKFVVGRLDLVFCK